MGKIAEYKRVISQQSFFEYAIKCLESLYCEGSGILPCSQICPHQNHAANAVDANSRRVHTATQSTTPSPLPSPAPKQSSQYEELFHSESCTDQGNLELSLELPPLFHRAASSAAISSLVGDMDTLSCLSEPTHTNCLNSLDPLPHWYDLQQHGPKSSQMLTVGSVFEMTPEDGKMLIDQLSTEGEM